MIKEQLAKNASMIIKDKDVVFLDAGSTCVELAKLLKDRDVKIFTNSIMIEELNLKNVEVFKGDAIEMIGAYASAEVINSISNQKFDKAFLGFASTRCGYNTSNQIEVQIKQTVMGVSKDSYAIGDVSKKPDHKVFRFAKKDELKLIVL